MCGSNFIFLFISNTFLYEGPHVGKKYMVECTNTMNTKVIKMKDFVTLMKS